jgi:hypothetical protein
LAWRQPSEGDQAFACFLQAVGHGALLEAPLADEGPATRLDLLPKGGQAAATAAFNKGVIFKLVARFNQLGEEGFEAVLSPKQRATPALARIFDGE